MTAEDVRNAITRLVAQGNRLEDDERAELASIVGELAGIMSGALAQLDAE